MSKETSPESAARVFINSLVWSYGWNRIGATWVASGNVFEVLVKGHKKILVQTFPDNEGFEVWRPVTESNSVGETTTAIAQYGASENG